MALERPIFDRLPIRNYQTNDPADWLTQWPDNELNVKAQQLEAFHLQLDPDTAAAASLDFLGYLVGYSGEFWSVDWPEAVKRTLIREAHGFLWPKRGTLAVIRRVLDIHGILHNIWQPGSLRLTFAMPGVFGGTGLRFFVRLPLSYRRTAKDWLEAERTLANYAPAISRSAVVYDRFYTGFSRLGDPMFTR